MKANETPKKIYIDAFLEKACEFIKNHHHRYTSWKVVEHELMFNTKGFIEDLKTYMKGE